jgi:hypothetical protein
MELRTGANAQVSTSDVIILHHELGRTVQQSSQVYQPVSGRRMLALHAICHSARAVEPSILWLPNSHKSSVTDEAMSQI